MHFRSSIPGGRPAGFVAPPPFYRWSWKREPFPLQKDWVRLVNTFWQNGDRKDGKGLSYFSCIVFLLAGPLRFHSDSIFRKKTTIPSIEPSIEHTLPPARLEFNFEGMPAIKTSEVSCCWRGMF